ncbi:MAG: CDP-diacylglycerol--glycerol-3-phosphate 3-phosphatidyltransferase [Alphaproteobacteria bacterium]|jgi:CDP-diacylglycerol--glycerol-3-phosphate 3-phosphatidyltransferase|nr:CDP-diacylglycerol--glycerol-3-phosphate 3-phosphatidyltransferase [Alphaproteobacteria bacterium]
MEFKNKIPNILTISRILVIPVVMGLFFVDSLWALWTILGLYIYASLTDFLDGYLARKWNVVSDLGRFLDPIADKLLVASLFIFLIASGQIEGVHVIAVALILIREMFVSGLREFMGPKNVVIHVTKLAKWKTTLQMVATCFLIINFVSPAIYLTGNVLLWVATVLTVITGTEYFKKSLKYMN